MWAYYNDNDPFVCDWLERLMGQGLIPQGDIDRRSIEEVEPADVEGYTQCHFFAGVSGWTLALDLAGVPRDRPLWTASCPCPPFSVAGKTQICPSCQSTNLVWDPGTTGYAVCADCGHTWLADKRHLWPEVWRLVAHCRPEFVFGEQVAGGSGRDWLSGVRGSLDLLSYVVRTSGLSAAGVGAPQDRQRLYWMAHTGSPRWGTQHQGGGEARPVFLQQEREEGAGGPGEFGPGWLGDSPSDDKRGKRESRAGTGSQEPAGGSGLSVVGLADALSTGRSLGARDTRDDGTPSEPARRQVPEQDGTDGRLVQPNSDGRPEREQTRTAARHGSPAQSTGSGMGDPEGVGSQSADFPHEGGIIGGDTGPWDDAVWVLGNDGKIRRTPCPESGLCVLAPRLPGHVGKLRGFGNAIVPQVAAHFIQQAFIDTEEA